MAVTNSGRTAPSTITHYDYDGTNAVWEWSEDPLTHVMSVAATYLIGPSGPVPTPCSNNNRRISYEYNHA